MNTITSGSIFSFVATGAKLLRRFRSNTISHSSPCRCGTFGKTTNLALFGVQCNLRGST